MPPSVRRRDRDRAIIEKIMTLKELESQLLSLSPTEKARAIQILSQSLANCWQRIEKIPGVVGGKARIAGTRIPV